MSTGHERFEILLMKAVDGLLPAEERSELDAHLQECETCRAELEDFELIKDTTDGMRERILQDARIEPIRESRKTRALLSTAFLFLLVGVLLLLGFAGYQLLTDEETPLLVKVGIGSASVGSAILFFHVLRIRLRGDKNDPYREIDL